MTGMTKETRGSVGWPGVAHLSLFWENFIQNLPTKFQLIWPNSFREDIFKLANHKQELPMVAMEIVHRLSAFRRRFKK